MNLPRARQTYFLFPVILTGRNFLSKEQSPPAENVPLSPLRVRPVAPHQNPNKKPTKKDRCYPALFLIFIEKISFVPALVVLHLRLMVDLQLESH